jgi:hypothetical protein
VASGGGGGDRGSGSSECVLSSSPGLCEYVIRVCALPAAALHTLPAMLQVRMGSARREGRELRD